MKPNKLLSALIVSIIGVGSFFAIAANKLDSKKIEPIEASSSISDTVYLELNSEYWGSYEAYYTIHYWGGSKGTTWPGTPFNNNNKAVGNTVISATWDTGSTHAMIMRWSDSSHTTEWKRWDYFDAHSFTAGSYNYFKNDGDTSCASHLVYENTGFAYFGNNKNWSNVHAYIFNSSHDVILDRGAWPGAQITDTNEDIVFDGVTGLYRISFTKILGNMIIFNNGSGGQENQTKDLSLVNDGYYNADYESTGDSTRGAAADFVYNLNVDRKAVTASGDIKKESICGISSETAANLTTTYNNLSSQIKGHINNATIFTYKDQDSTTADTNVHVSSIMQQLSGIGGTPLLTLFVPSTNKKFSGLTFISIISITFLLSFGTHYLIKKKIV